VPTAEVKSDVTPIGSRGLYSRGSTDILLRTLLPQPNDLFGPFANALDAFIRSESLYRPSGGQSAQQKRDGRSEKNHRSREKILSRYQRVGNGREYRVDPQARIHAAEMTNQSRNSPRRQLSGAELLIDSRLRNMCPRF